MSQIDKVVIMSHDEGYAPPEQPVLEVTYVGPGGSEGEGNVYFKLVRVIEESDKRSEYETISEHGVKVSDLAKALLATGAFRFLETADPIYLDA